MRVLLLTLALSSVFLVAKADLEHLLQHILKQDYFHNLSTQDQVILVELATEGQVGRLSQYIHKVGEQRIREIIKQLPPHEGQQLEHYIHQHLHPNLHHTTTMPPTPQV